MKNENSKKSVTFVTFLPPQSPKGDFQRDGKKGIDN